MKQPKTATRAERVTRSPDSLTYEYKTTHGNLASYWSDPEQGRVMDAEASDPLEPDGEGWELVAMAASSVLLYWSWRRKVNASKRSKVQP